MPSHPPQWTDFLQCSECEKKFSLQPDVLPVSLPCSHTVCKRCISTLFKTNTGCRYDQNCLSSGSAERHTQLPVNLPLLKIIAHQANASPSEYSRFRQLEEIILSMNDFAAYERCINLIELMAEYLEEIKDGILPPNPSLTKPMLRKLVVLIQCQISVSEGRIRALRACRAIGERVATELILAHQNPATLSGNLWTAVRARGCQFLGPAMQEEALRLILLALEDGSELSRKVLVMFVVHKLQKQFPQASKTSTGHVVQLLYRASCFVVKKREGDSSLMKLKEDFRTYNALRREHDAQVVQIAREAGLRIAPDQWSALLYGDQSHKSHMQSIIDRLQSTETLSRCIQDLANALEKPNSPDLKSILPHFESLANISEIVHHEDIDDKNEWIKLRECLQAISVILREQIKFSQNHMHNLWRDEETNVQSAKFKTSFCRDIKNKGRCPRGDSCTFAHTEEELHSHRNKRKKGSVFTASKPPSVLLKSMAEPEYHSSPEGSLSPKVADEISRGSKSQHLVPTVQEQPAHREVPQQYKPRPVTPTYLHNLPRPPDQLLPMQPNMPYGPTYLPTPYYQSYQKPHQMVDQSSHGAVALPRPSDSVTLKTGQQFVGPNPQQQNFTVTLSFQANPDQQSMQLSSANISGCHPNNISEVNGKNRAPNPVDPALERYGPESNNLPQMRPMPTYDPNYYSHHVGQDPHSYYRMRSPDPAFVSPTLPHPAIYHPESPLYPNSMPHPMMQHFGQDHLCKSQYPQQPTYRQPSPVGHVSPIVMTPSPHPHQSVITPVVPMQPYEAYRQTPPPQMQPYVPHPSSLVHSGAIFCIREQGEPATGLSASMGELQISKSVEHASVDDLVRRKREILQQMIQNQNTDAEWEHADNDDNNYFDVWRCRSYSPLLRIGGTPTVPENLNEKQGSATVNVTAELDTGTKQVTVRGVDHLNPSHARNERILDDKKMHRLLLEKNVEKCIQASTTATGTMAHSVSVGHREHLRYNPHMDDDMIPFSDRPTVSKYGPIARSTRTKPIDTDYVQVSAGMCISTQPVSAILRTSISNQSASNENIYSSFDNHDAISCFAGGSHHSSSLRGSDGLSPVNADDQRKMHSKASLSQAVSNSRLVRREQTAIEQSASQTTNQDLKLLAELQQIELGLQQKKQYKS